jgi:predicted nuclease of predicted toxin-antitoxin system
LKLLLDEMYAPVIADQLRYRGHDVVAVKERSDLMTKQDEYLFAVAQFEGRAILTENFRHFQPFHLSALVSGNTHSGLIYTTNRSFYREKGSEGGFIRALEALLTSGDDISGREVWMRPV